MKPELKTKLPLKTAKLAFSIITIVFAVLSFIYVDSRLLRIITQGSLSVAMLINGLQTLAEQKHKPTGYYFIGLSVFLLFVMLYTIIAGFKIGDL